MGVFQRALTTMRTQRDRGIGTLESIAIVIVAAILVSGVLVVKNIYPDAINNAVCQLRAAIGESVACEAGQYTADDGPTDFDLAPPTCKIYEETEKTKVEAGVWIFKVGTETAFIVREYSDGTVRATMIDGYTGGVGWELDPGGLGVVDVDIGIDAGYKSGDTWVFENNDEWQDMKAQIQAYRDQTGFWPTLGRNIAFWKDHDLVDEPRPADIVMKQYDISAHGKASTEFESDSLGPVNTKTDLHVGLELGGTKIVEVDKRTGEETQTFEFSGQYDTGFDVDISVDIEESKRGNENKIGTEASATAMQKVEGAFSVTRDENMDIVEISFESVREVGAEFDVDVSTGPGGDDPKKVQGIDSAAAGIEREGDVTNARVTKTVLTVDDSNRDIVNDWLGEPNDLTMASKVPLGALIPDEPSDDPFLQLLYEEATVNQVDYLNIADKSAFDASIKNGIKLGFSVSQEDSTAALTDAHYLGNPGSDGNRVMKSNEECILASRN